ncbi:hypothetical protein NHX12_003505 [Muraenolepis orangiensis]|uniref:Uncharacterized protein n=1 Tax=Muraenolepis orangiensis TaxID=630683 RepID=A0A9Q0DY64_9TELE|nr:hypothetical protein NHX12_003505 [Muraenolepis orangiensis]
MTVPATCLALETRVVLLWRSSLLSLDPATVPHLAHLKESCSAHPLLDVSWAIYPTFSGGPGPINVGPPSPPGPEFTPGELARVESTLGMEAMSLRPRKGASHLFHHLLLM